MVWPSLMLLAAVSAGSLAILFPARQCTDASLIDAA